MLKCIKNKQPIRTENCVNVNWEFSISLLILNTQNIYTHFLVCLTSTKLDFIYGEENKKIKKCCSEFVALNTSRHHKKYIVCDTQCCMSHTCTEQHVVWCYNCQKGLKLKRVNFFQQINIKVIAIYCVTVKDTINIKLNGLYTHTRLK